jgi:hypothetical protein
MNEDARSWAILPHEGCKGLTLAPFGCEEGGAKIEFGANDALGAPRRGVRPPLVVERLMGVALGNSRG